MDNQSPVRAALGVNTTHLSVCKKVLPYLDDADPSTRAEAAAGIEETLDHHPGGGDLLAAIRISTPHLLARLEDVSPDVRTAVRSAVTTLARRARRGGDYADAADLFDALVERPPLPTPLLWLERWECRLALGRDEEAAADLVAFREATRKADSEALDAILSQDRHGPRNLDAWRADALTRIATRDLANTARACRLLEESRALDQSRVDTRLADIAAGQPPPRWRYRPAETYALLGLLAERGGRIDEALALLEIANTLSPTGGLGAHVHSELYDAWLRRLKDVRDGQTGVPRDFDASWFVDSTRTPAELQKAMAQWSQIDWRRLPRTVDEALDTPLVALLMTAMERLHMGHAAYANAATPEDRVLYTRHLPLFEAQFGHRFDTWQTALSPSGDALTVIFDPLSQRPGNLAAQAAAFVTWLEATRRATSAREILAALPAQAFDNLAIPLGLRGPYLDRQRYLAELVFGATNDGAIAARAVRLYATLWNEKGIVPRPAWEKEAKALELPRTKALAEALFTYTEEAARRLWIAEHTPLPELLDLKLLWPLAFAWHETLTPKLAALLEGSLDGKKKASPSMRAKREKTLAWLTQRVRTPWDETPRPAKKTKSKAYRTAGSEGR